jgi:arginine/lysine/ornithine decarboxylase
MSSCRSIAGFEVASQLTGQQDSNSADHGEPLMTTSRTSSHSYLLCALPDTAAMKQLVRPCIDTT